VFAVLHWATVPHSERKLGVNLHNSSSSGWVANQRSIYLADFLDDPKRLTAHPFAFDLDSDAGGFLTRVSIERWAKGSWKYAGSTITKTSTCF
jgi:hypothetical protein